MLVENTILNTINRISFFEKKIINSFVKFFFYNETFLISMLHQIFW